MADTGHTGEVELLRRSAAGDSGAFEAFVALHQAAVFRFLRASTADAADAEDALQETFVAAWRSSANYRGDAPPRAWILGIARNAARHARRRRAGEPADFVSLDDLGLDAGWGAEDPEQALSATLRREALQAALARLPASDREILVLRELEELDGASVAAMLGLTVAAMKSRLHRARLRLAAEVRKEREYA